MSETKKIIAGMLKENTGRHFLDSGGAYGRHWEINQERDFDAEPAATLNFRWGLEVTLNVYHWLCDRVEYAPDLDDQFHLFAKEFPREGWLETCERWFDHLKDRGRKVGCIIDEDRDPQCINTYNHECLLSQTLQFYPFVMDNAPLVLLQIHGGCDVRGGYTAPRVFHLGSALHDYYAIHDFDRATIWACVPDDVSVIRYGSLNPEPFIVPNSQLKLWENWSHEDAPYWDTDDGYHWYQEGCSSGIQLQEYEQSENLSDKGKGMIYVDDDGKGYCPLTGFALEACSYP